MSPDRSDADEGPGQVVTTVPGPPEAPAVALTFDDGPGPHTPDVLAVLARYGVRATFFVCGRSVQDRPDLLRETVAAGHALGNHTLTHPQAVPGSRPFGHFDELDEDVQAAQIDSTAAAVAAALGPRAEPLRWFRGPGGRHHGDRTARVTAARGLAVVEWSADPGDWDAPPEVEPDFVRAITARATAGAVATTRRPVLVLHDHKASAEPEEELSGFRGNTVAALPRIIEFHLTRGATFCAPDGSSLTAG